MTKVIDLLEYFKDKPVIREQLRKNLNAQHPEFKGNLSELDNKVNRNGDKSLHLLLTGTLTWNKTPEGNSYWRDIYSELKNKGV